MSEADLDATEVQQRREAVVDATERLDAFVKANLGGACRMLSEGDACQCPLCDLGRLREEIRREWWA